MCPRVEIYVFFKMFVTCRNLSSNQHLKRNQTKSSMTHEEMEDQEEKEDTFQEMAFFKASSPQDAK